MMCLPGATIYSLLDVFIYKDIIGMIKKCIIANDSQGVTKKAKSKSQKSPSPKKKSQSKNTVCSKIQVAGINIEFRFINMLGNKFRRRIRIHFINLACFLTNVKPFLFGEARRSNVIVHRLIRIIGSNYYRRRYVCN